MSKVIVRRICWFDPEFDGQSDLGWSGIALLIATVFLNIAFANGQGVYLWLFCPLPLFAVLTASVALIIASLFFIGPALAIQSARTSLFALLDDSLGTVPAFAMRACSVIYLVLWIAALISLPLRVWSSSLDREASAGEFATIATILAVFLFVTSQQKLQTVARLASFNDKLGIAILIAALIRVRDGWPDALATASFERHSWNWEVWAGTSELAFYAAPLLLLASGLSSRLAKPREVALVGMLGVSAPLALTLFLVGVIGAATHASHFYQPSLQPSVAMALWSHTARTAVQWRALVAGVTIFGAVRLGSRFLADATVVYRRRKNVRWILQFGLCGAIGWLSLAPFSVAFTSTLDWSARCLGVCSAVLTVDFLTRKNRTYAPKVFDSVGVIAIVAGLVTPVFIEHGPLEFTANPWRYPWLLPSYVVALSVCLSGRLLQMVLRARRVQTIS